MAGLFFDGRSVEKKIEDAKVLLENNGYLVRGPLIVKNKVKGPADLVKFFYDKMVEYNPNLTMYHAGSRKRDLGMAKAFIEARQEVGVSKAVALSECCALVEALFKYEARLGLNFKVSSMSVFGQDSLGWITDKLVDILNGFDAAVSIEKDALWFDSFYAEQENSVPAVQVQHANKILGLEENDGKEKE